MFEVMIEMLEVIDKSDIKKDKDFQILKGIYKIPSSYGEIVKQKKIK